MNVLVVDDDATITRMMCAMVHHLGHRACGCLSGAAALSEVLRQEFDLILCDINLGDIHGFELMRAIKAQSPDVPIIAVTAMLANDVGQEAAQAGACHFIEKPLRIDALRTEISLVEASKQHRIDVAIIVHDPLTRMRTKRSLEAVGCRVKLVPVDKKHEFDPSAMQLVLLEATDDDAMKIVKRCGALQVGCFVLVPEGQTYDDDPWLRAGASLVVPMPLQADAVVNQARFLGVGPR
jgi:CheY-like chemotaxis protein